MLAKLRCDRNTFLGVLANKDKSKVTPIEWGSSCARTMLAKKNVREKQQIFRRFIIFIILMKEFTINETLIP